MSSQPPPLLPFGTFLFHFSLEKWIKNRMKFGGKKEDEGENKNPFFNSPTSWRIYICYITSSLVVCCQVLCIAWLRQPQYFFFFSPHVHFLALCLIGDESAEITWEKALERDCRRQEIAECWCAPRRATSDVPHWILRMTDDDHSHAGGRALILFCPFYCCPLGRENNCVKEKMKAGMGPNRDGENKKDLKLWNEEYV